MNFNMDISLSTLLVSVVIAAVGYGLKGVAWALAEVCSKLFNMLLEATAKIEIFEKKIDAFELKFSEVTANQAAIQKLRRDLNTLQDAVQDLRKFKM